jgi:hypothetical protein
MRTQFRKEDIEFHSDRGPAHPAINVKVRSWVSPTRTAEHFKCSEDVAEKALRFAFETAQESFWEDARELAAHYLGGGLKVYSEGRSNGWLVVHGLPPVESWDALRVSRWGNFSRAIARDIAYRTKEETMWESIDANQWAKDGAEAFNFVDGEDGKPVCIADLKQQAKEAGFGPVVRS